MKYLHVSKPQPFLPTSKAFPPSHATSNLLVHIRAYKKACMIKYGNDTLDVEGAPIYTVMWTEKKRTMSLHALRNHTLSSRDKATAVFHLINLAAMKKARITCKMLVDFDNNNNNKHCIAVWSIQVILFQLKRVEPSTTIQWPMQSTVLIYIIIINYIIIYYIIIYYILYPDAHLVTCHYM